MQPGKVLQFPIRNARMFSPEIKSEILGSSRVGRVLYAAIEALPYVGDPALKEDLKQALCELLLGEDGVA
ncbi:MAG TPA: hypothetical protein VFA85_15840 [Terriglobales bacterium]|nr:hypothetical protein [Terriglobales bacterium]